MPKYVLLATTLALVGTLVVGGQAYAKKCKPPLVCKPTKVIPKRKLVPCAKGKVRSADTRGRCCWPGQVYSRLKKKCIGTPSKCIEPLVPAENGCVEKSEVVAEKEPKIVERVVEKVVVVEKPKIVEKVVVVEKPKFVEKVVVVEKPAESKKPSNDMADFEPPQEKSGGSSATGWTLLSIGLVSLGTGGYFLSSWQDNVGMAERAESDCKDQAGAACFEAGGTRGIEDLYRQGSTDQIVGWSASGLGLFLGLIGVVILSKDGGADADTAAAAGLEQPQPINVYPVIHSHSMGIGGNF